MGINEIFISHAYPYMFFSFAAANCEVLANLFHSLDIWHKSVKLTAKISAVRTIHDFLLIQ